MKKENVISYDIRGAAFKVYNILGPGLLESVYEHAMAHELRKMGYNIQTQKGLPLKYDSTQMAIGFRLDIMVDDLVIVEIKSVETLLPVHFKQLLTYLKLANKKLGILINFNSSNLQESIKRIAN